MYSKTIDNSNNMLAVLQGNTLGNRQDAKIVKMYAEPEEELEELEIAA